MRRLSAAVARAGASDEIRVIDHAALAH